MAESSENEFVWYIALGSLFSIFIAFIIFLIVDYFIEYAKRAETENASEAWLRIFHAMSKANLLPTYPVEMPSIGPKPSDAYHTAFLLSKVTLADLVPTIMDMAEFWVDVPLASNTHEFRVTEENAGSIYLVAELPQNFPPKSLRSLTFSVTSRDQGYSNMSPFHHTYHHSWTWFEVAILPDDEESGTEFEEETKTPPPGKWIITNIHADKDWETHTVTWSCNDEDEEIRDIVASLRPGSKIAITAWARYPAWVNNVRSARIDCQINGVRKL